MGVRMEISVFTIDGIGTRHHSHSNQSSSTWSYTINLCEDANSVIGLMHVWCKSEVNSHHSAGIKPELLTWAATTRKPVALTILYMVVLNLSIAHQTDTQYVPSELCYVETSIWKKVHTEWYFWVWFPGHYRLATFMNFHLKTYLCFSWSKCFHIFFLSQVEIVMNSNSMLQVVTDNDLRGEQVYIFSISYCSSG